MNATISLRKEWFSEKEQRLVTAGELAASLFCFESGVQAVRLSNVLGELVLLPYQGQQIWSAMFHGRELAMKSMFDQPYPTRDFLSNFGGFLVHCGVLAMGSPSAEDSHPLHGELPNAPYQKAQLLLGEDEKGTYIALTGENRHTVAFNASYTARPCVKLYANSAIFDVSMTVTNLKNSDMPLMYLAHVNFRPEVNARLAQSVLPNPQAMRVRADVPAFMQTPAGYREFLAELKLHPEKHLALTPDLKFDPEVVFYFDYLADEQGWARTLQIHADGSADVVRHKPAQLNRGVRWICRTVDQEALGFEPATAEVEGFRAEEKKGNVRVLGGGESFFCELQVGLLTFSEAAEEERAIARAISAVG
ncbi:hypothetical protein ADN00_06255 [Ornatilinea apprima]|uniref:Deoxyribose mutarotase n=1 Tax=Ornatilinea apprima TaxID=1134406 RepID=A0A0P6XGH4_9CHLR|nr:DUF4432 family protein [Ornatilinea apprima]KPL78819.1 hypothetical protein ADN00_06255 [Ornatilinea apprima]